MLVNKIDSYRSTFEYISWQDVQCIYNIIFIIAPSYVFLG